MTSDRDEHRARESWESRDERPEFRFGEGKISGVTSVVLGALCVLAVLCFRYPALLTTPDLREVLPLDLVRIVLFGANLLALGFGALCYALGGQRRLAFAGIALSALAIGLGGAWVEAPESVTSTRYLGVDWFVLDLLLLALVFLPLERMFALHASQHIFRRGWRTDLAHFFVSHLLVQVTVLLTMAPAGLLLGALVSSNLQATVAALPGGVQFGLALVLADLFQYGAHRMMHAVPWLWRFHAIHHSSTQMDWLAGSRLHLLDIVVTRATSFLPLFLLGIAAAPLSAYLVFVSFQAVLIHANVRFRFGPLRWLLATPEFHHWHHSAEPQAVDRNFAVHVPLLDWLFGTAYLPGRWPLRYGIEGNPVPEGYLAQIRWPLERDAS
jgi:sterol desaturase/sphingolipid hydroxylase (fatty acid hydroxylase superfamily)